MNSHQIGLGQAQALSARSQNHCFPVPHVDRPAEPHLRGVRPWNTQSLPNGDLSAEDFEEFVDSSYCAHGGNATERIVIRQADLYRQKCNYLGMKIESNERLKQARIAAGYETATAAAAAFDWSAVTYRAHEAGGRRLRQDAAEKYARAFRVSAAWLMTGEGSMKPSRINLPARPAIPPGRPLPTDSSAMSPAAQAAFEGLLTELGVPEDEAAWMVRTVLSSVAEIPISGVDPLVQARVSAVSAVRERFRHK
jgi:hypothetical protein